METDFYALLGVSRTATDDELKKAYRKLARELHPDSNPNDAEAEERFKQVTLAYEVLRDPERRQRYDRYGIDGVRGTGSAGGGAGDPFAGMGDMGLGDLFDAFFGGGSPFGSSGGQRRGRGGPPAGSDVEATVVLDFEQAVFGGQREITLRVPVVCDVCEGSGAEPGTEPTECTMCQGQGEVRRVRQSILGQVVTASPCTRCQGTGREIATPCPTCHGEGRRTLERAYTVDIPAGVDRGQTLRLQGKGAAGPRGGPPGDLYIRIDVKPHDRFERHQYDLHFELHAAMTQAALGAHIVVPTLDGQEDVFIDPGTQTGRVYKFRGKGVPYLDGRGRGDLVITLFVDTPEKLNKEQQEVLLSLAELRGEDVGTPENGLFGKIKGAFK